MPLCVKSGTEPDILDNNAFTADTEVADQNMAVMAVNWDFVS